MTLDRTVRLLAAAMEEPELRLSRATALVDYHVRRNEVTRKSHSKTWRVKHPGVKYLRLKNYSRPEPVPVFRCQWRCERLALEFLSEPES